MSIKVSLPSDERGFTGRECPKCFKYFKLKFGTGLPISICHCPYCGHTGDHNEFFTKDQIKYVKSIALREVMKRVVEPELRKLERSFKELERATKGGFIQIEVKTKRSPITFSLKYYQEREVETYVTCDNCGLEFAIYGIFANCPDCGKLNALIIFKKSIEVARKRIHLLDMIEGEDELQEAILEDALSSGVSTFDALGKVLQSRYPDIFPQRPKNLFQNLKALSDALSKSIRKSLSDIIGRENSEFLFKMFQVRHIYEHNMGVIDDDFVRKISNLGHLKGRKYLLKQDEIEKFLAVISGTGEKILKIVEDKVK